MQIIMTPTLQRYKGFFRHAGLVATMLLGLCFSATLMANSLGSDSMNTISNEFEVEDEIQDIADPQGDGITQADLVVEHNQDLGTDGEAQPVNLAPLILAE